MSDNRRRKYFSEKRDTFFNKLVSDREGMCDNCKSKEDLQIHHIVPLGLGGSNYLSNLSLLCYRCHSKAHGMDRRGSFSESVRRGIKKAKDSGKKLGRPEAKETTRAVQRAKAEGLSQSQASKRLDLSIATVKRHWNKRLEEGNE